MKLVASTVTVKWTANKTESQVLGVRRNILASRLALVLASPVDEEKDSKSSETST